MDCNNGKENVIKFHETVSWFESRSGLGLYLDSRQMGGEKIKTKESIQTRPDFLIVLVR